jgi:hypothetical protein
MTGGRYQKVERTRRPLTIRGNVIGAVENFKYS